jgi:formamidopyrimidine-DNA glycosylase
MPELPDVVLYVEHLERSLRGATLHSAAVRSPNLLRTAAPPLTAAVGRRVASVRRLGKRVVLVFESDLFLVFHLMIAGRFHWRTAAGKTRRGSKPLPRTVLAAFEFSSGELRLTEAGTRKRASLHVIVGEDALRGLDPGGLEVLTATFEEFSAVLDRENHTLKRSLTDPRLFSGIGNAYSDEILHRARLSPLRQTRHMDVDERASLYRATRDTLLEWTARLREEAGDEFPEKVTAFRAGMAVHGRYGEPCPDCGAPVQRIVYAENEVNYCARCQTGGRLLADRALSKLLKTDWPRTLEEREGLS